MKKIDPWIACAVLLIAACLGGVAGSWLAGPMPTPDRTVEPERNYTQETLRILNPPPPPTIEYYRGRPEDNYGSMAVSTGMYYPNGDREYARIRR